MIRSDSEYTITLRSAGFTLQNHIIKGSFLKPWLYLKNMEKENTVWDRRWWPILDQQRLSRHTFVSKQSDVSAKDYANFLYYLWWISIERPTSIKWPLAGTPRVAAWSPQWRFNYTVFLFFSWTFCSLKPAARTCLKSGRQRTCIWYEIRSFPKLER